MCAELMRGPFIPCEGDGDGDGEGRIGEKSEVHSKGFPSQGQCASDYIPQWLTGFEIF